MNIIYKHKYIHILNNMEEREIILDELPIFNKIKYDEYRGILVGYNIYLNKKFISLRGV